MIQQIFQGVRACSSDPNCGNAMAKFTICVFPRSEQKVQDVDQSHSSRLRLAPNEAPFETCERLSAEAERPYQHLVVPALCYAVCIPDPGLIGLKQLLLSGWREVPWARRFVRQLHQGGIDPAGDGIRNLLPMGLQRFLIFLRSNPHYSYIIAQPWVEIYPVNCVCHMHNLCGWL